MIRSAIDWSLIGKAVAFYEAARFKYVEVPWVVDRRAIAATLPRGAHPLCVRDDIFKPSTPGKTWEDMRALVGSAEQGFLQMMLDGKLAPGSYVAASPCFRDDEVDELHFKDFMKCELIMVIDHEPDRSYARSLALEAAVFFRKVGGAESQHLKLVETDRGLDLELGGVEIGSYGARSYEGHRWIYGTGCAEPRFSQAMARVNRR